MVALQSQNPYCSGFQPWHTYKATQPQKLLISDEGNWDFPSGIAFLYKDYGVSPLPGSAVLYCQDRGPFRLLLVGQGGTSAIGSVLVERSLRRPECESLNLVMSKCTS